MGPTRCQLRYSRLESLVHIHLLLNACVRLGRVLPLRAVSSWCYGFPCEAEFQTVISAQSLRTSEEGCSNSVYQRHRGNVGNSPARPRSAGGLGDRLYRLGDHSPPPPPKLCLEPKWIRRACARATPRARAYALAYPRARCSRARPRPAPTSSRLRARAGPCVTSGRSTEAMAATSHRTSPRQ